MNLKDTLQLSNWLRSKSSLSEVEAASPVGLVGNERFSGDARRAFRLAWGWSAHRFHGTYGAWQESVYIRHGKDFVDRRIARCRNKITAFQT